MLASELTRAEREAATPWIIACQTRKMLQNIRLADANTTQGVTYFSRS
jgi:hypothetical protein